MTYTDFEAETRANPLDQVERMAALNEWSFERSAEDEITISLEGRWTDCHVSFQWMDEVGIAARRLRLRPQGAGEAQDRSAAPALAHQ